MQCTAFHRCDWPARAAQAETRSCRAVATLVLQTPQPFKICAADTVHKKRRTEKKGQGISRRAAMLRAKGGGTARYKKWRGKHDNYLQD